MFLGYFWASEIAQIRTDFETGFSPRGRKNCHPKCHSDGKRCGGLVHDSWFMENWLEFVFLRLSLFCISNFHMFHVISWCFPPFRLGFNIEEALGLAHRAQQKHPSLSTSRTIQQQLQRSLILAGKLRGETKKVAPIFSQQISSEQVEALIYPDIAQHKNNCVFLFLGNDLGNLFGGAPFLRPRFFDGVLKLKFLRPHFGLCKSVQWLDCYKTHRIEKLRTWWRWTWRFEVVWHDIAIVGDFNWFLQNFHHKVWGRWNPFWQIFFKVVVQPPQIEVQFNKKCHIFMKGSYLNHLVACSATPFFCLCTSNETAPTNGPGIQEMLSSNWSKLQPLLPKRFSASAKPGKRKRNASTENVETVEKVEKRNGESTIPKAWKECCIAERCVDSNSFRMVFSVWQSDSLQDISPCGCPGGQKRKEAESTKSRKVVEIYESRQASISWACIQDIKSLRSKSSLKCKTCTLGCWRFPCFANQGFNWKWADGKLWKLLQNLARFCCKIRPTVCAPCWGWII